jgi:hypothetical protein
MASSNDLITALRELRSDPLVASVLRGEPDSATSARLKSVVDALPGSCGTNARVTPPSNASCSQLETQLYYRSRDADRDAVGVENWLQHHREALSASESKRLESRLRAEHLFAASQMEIGLLKAEHAETSARMFLQTEELKKQRLRDAEEQEGLEARQYADKLQRTATDIDVLSPLPQQPPGSAGGASVDRRIARAASVDTSVQTPSFLAPRGAILYEPSEEPSLYASGVLPSSSLLIDTSQLGEIDEEKNYAEKARLYGSLAGGSPPPGSTGAPSTSALGLSATKPSAGRSAGTHTRDAAAVEVAGLREAVEQRDRTIRRLERQLHEDRVYYETQLSRAKQDLQQAEMMADSRVAALRAQLDEALSRRRPGTSSVEYTADEVQQKLLAVQQMYRANLEELKEASSRAFETVQEQSEARILEVTSRAEKAIADARESFRRDRFDSLAKDKEQLMLVLTREMELALRESELAFRDSIHEAVSSKIRDEIQLVFRKHLQSDVLPTVQIKMVQDVRSQVGASSQKELEGVCAEKVMHLRQIVRDEVALLAPKIEHTFSQIADRHDHLLQTVDKGVLDVLTAEIRNLQTSVREVDTETLLQESLEQQHRQKMLVYHRRIEELENGLETERAFQRQVRASIATHAEKRAAQILMDVPVPIAASPATATAADGSGGSEQTATGSQQDAASASASRGVALPPWMRSGSGSK